MGSQKEKEALLSENDSIWRSTRYQHIAEVIENLLGEFNAFIKENKATKLYSGVTLFSLHSTAANLVTQKKIDNLKQMGEAMRAMPQYQEMLNKVSVYMLHYNS